LIHYITVEPSEDADKNVGYKFPFNACEILSSENLAIIDKFFEEDEKENKKSSEAGDDNDNDFDNENQFKNKILIENQNKENKETLNQENKKNEEENTNQVIHMEADINMKSNSDNLLIFEEILSASPGNEENNVENNQEQKEIVSHTPSNEEIKIENNQETKQIQENINDNLNVQQEHDQIPQINNTNNEQQNSIDNEENTTQEKKQNMIHEENFSSQENKDVKENIQEAPEHKLIDELLRFVETDKPLNYVLSGYFSKIFLNILNLKTNNLITYLFISKKQFLKSLIYHSNMKSISDIILKLLNTNLSEIEGGEDIKTELIYNIMDNYSNCEHEVILL